MHQNRSKLKHLYDSIHLNLGIKRFIKNILIPSLENQLSSLDNLIFLPIIGSLTSYLYERVSYHYGANYRIGNYKSHNLDTKTANYGYGYFHYALVRNLRPSRVLCIGSTYGYIPFICALACKDNKKGVVDFVDASYDLNNPEDKDRHSFGEGFWKKVNPNKHFSYLGTGDFIKTYVMTTKLFSEKYPNRKYDYIYIDGDHSYQGVKLDYKLFWPKLKKGGIISFHDTDTVGKYGNLYFDVDRFLKETVYKNSNFLHFPNNYSGLVISQKA